MISKRNYKVHKTSGGDIERERKQAARAQKIRTVTVDKSAVAYASLREVALPKHALEIFELLWLKCLR